MNDLLGVDGLTRDTYEGMETYRKHRSCPKCGTTSVGTTFVRGRYFPAIPLYGIEPLRCVDVMRRSCFNCKHAWFERPLDA